MSPDLRLVEVDDPTTADASADASAAPATHQATVNTALRDPPTAAILFDAKEGRLAYDRRAGEYMLDDHLLDLEIAVTTARERSGQVFTYFDADGKVKVVNFGRETFLRGIELVAQENKIDRVRDYITALPPWDSVDRIADLTSALRLREPHPLYSVFLRRTMIAAVARALSPGCKVDTILILHDPQGGALKSSFFRLLAGPQFFSDSDFDIKDKDSFARVNKFWIHEFAELDALRSRATRESTKAFLSRREDSFRPPYGRANKTYPRASIFVGSTNDDEFLTDDGGLRRFWVVPNVGKIDLSWVAANRDQLWAQARASFEAGEQWWLTPEEEALHAPQLLQHLAAQPGFEELAEWITTKQATEVKVKDILIRFGALPGKQPAFNEKRGAGGLALFDARTMSGAERVIGQYLRRLGFEKTHTRSGKVWRKVSN